MKWAENCGEHLSDMGSPVTNAKRLDMTGSTSSGSEAGGYFVIQADSMIKVEELLKDDPHLAWSECCYVEIHEKIPLPKC